MDIRKRIFIKKEDRKDVKSAGVLINENVTAKSVVCPVCKAARGASCLFKVRDGHQSTNIPHAERVVAAEQFEDNEQRKKSGFSQNQVERQLSQLLEHSNKYRAAK